MTGRAGKQRAKGFTLFEALLAAVILAIAVVAVALPFTAGARSQEEETRKTLAVSLAEDLMEEILLKPFEEPGDGDHLIEEEEDFGPEPDEASRAHFDAIDDYHGYTEAPGAVTGPDGAVLPDRAASWLSRHVTVEYVYVQDQDQLRDPSFLRVTVMVRYRGDPLVTLTRLVHWLR